jgi:alpha-tubulin suppressor-like RCC1 family protein
MNNSTKLAKVLLPLLALSLLCAAAFVQSALPHLASADSGTASPNDAGQTPDYGTNLWLQISSVSNGTVSLILHNTAYTQTGEVYEVWSKTNLTTPNWNIETDVWAVANTNWTPFTVPVLGRPTLFIWARDWTGIDDSNGIPEWWEYEHPGVLPPVITAQPTNQTVVQGNNATFSVEVSTNSTTPLSYQWYFNGTNLLAGATDTSLTLTNVQSTNAGVYSVLVTNAFGSAASSNAVLTVLEPPLITTQPTNQTVFQGSDATFTVTATGTMPLGYQWYFNGANLLAGATNASLVLTNVSSTNAGNYLVVVSNQVGTVTSSNAVLAVNPAGLLGYWPFDDTNWLGAQGQVPLIATNLQLVSGWSSNAVELDATDAYLYYRLVEDDGHTNLNMQCGTVQFWFYPESYGAPLGYNLALIEVTPEDPNSNGFWGLYLYTTSWANGVPQDLNIGFDSGDETGTNWSGSIYAPLNWSSNQWHQIALTYTPTNITLYIDGLLVTNANGISAFPSTFDRFTIGNDIWNDTAYGRFDELYTYDYPLSAEQIAADYRAALNLPNLEIVSGNNQMGPSGSFLPQPLVVQATGNNSETLSNAPITFTVTIGGAQLAVATNNPTTTNLTLSTDSNGLASVWIYFPTTTNLLENVISVQAAGTPVSTNANAYLDADGNGLPDYWEIQYFGTNGLDPNSSPDGNGQSLLYDYQNGIDPTDYYSGHQPNLEIVSGNFQSGSLGSFLPLPLTVRVTDSNSNILTNAPITLTAWGNAQFAATTNDILETSLSLRTDSNGLVSAWVYIPMAAFLQNSVMFVSVLAYSGSNVGQTNFVEFIGSRIPMLAAGAERIMELTTSGDVISWGGNQYGEFGDYTFLDSTNPVHVVGFTNLIKIASGLNHFLAIDSNGALWAWGDNEYGQLGDGGAENNTNRPVQVSMMSSVIAVAGGFDHSVAVKADGTVWSWGDNEYGQLGDGGTEYDTNLPVRVQGLPTNAIAVAAGYSHTLALLGDGTVWAWGDDSFNQLGDGNWASSSTPVPVPGLTGIAAICAGGNHSLALDTNGNVWAWGSFDLYHADIVFSPLETTGLLAGADAEDNGYWPAMVAGLTNVVSLAAGASHCLALDNDGKVWAWGFDGVGQLGDGGPDNNGGQYDIEIPSQIMELTNIVAIAAGSDASVAVDSNGNLWQWGASDSDGTNWTWGDENGYPALAQPYVDFYNDHLPNLTMLNGNDQVSYESLEFPQPLVFQVTDTNGVALSNAPVSVEVIAGDMELRTQTGGDNYKGLRLTTDANGEVTLFGYADRYASNTNCIVRVLAASREKIRELDFTETLTPTVYPTVTFTSTNMYLVRSDSSNSNVTITGYAQSIYGAIQEIDFQISTNGGAYVTLGSTTQTPFSLTLTNVYEGTYSIQAEAEDQLGLWSDPASTSITVYLDADGNGLPDYWEIEYFGTNGLDPDSSPDGNGQSLLYDYQNGIDPTDYYNGNPPKWQIVSGNDQNGSPGSFLPLPLTVQVTGANSVALSNAPVTFAVSLGGARVSATTNDMPITNLTLRADSNGLVSAWVYFPTGVYVTDNIITVRPQSDQNLTVLEANEVVPGRLGYWRFDNPYLTGEEGQNPQYLEYVISIPDWSGNSVELNSNYLNSILDYRDVETNGEANVNVWTGSIRFWFKPDWISGTGPGNEGILIEIGSQRPNLGGLWALVISADGTTLSFLTQQNYYAPLMANLTASINWSNDWHQIVLTYGPSNSVLYLDGQPAVTNGAGVVYYPDAATWSWGIDIGGDLGWEQAKGQFDELETFNYQLPESAWLTVNLTSPTNNAILTTSSTNVIAAAVSDTNATISQVEFFNGNQLIGTATSPPYTVNWIPFAGTHQLTALAIDSQGNGRFSSPVLVTVDVDSNGDGIPDIVEVESGNDPMNPWLPPSPDPNDHTAPNITLLIPTNTVLLSP